MRLFFIPVLILISFSVFAQNKRANNWHFGSHCALTFNTVPTTTLSGSAIDTEEGTSCISDTAGNMLFYTDGISVYDKNNVQMPNGNYLNGHASSTQSALIIPNPKRQNIYYIFTTGATAGAVGVNCKCLCYSVVDLNLNSGNGDVTSRNIPLSALTTEKLAAYATDSALWVVAHAFNSNDFQSYKVDSSGVNTIPVLSNCGIGNTFSSSWGTASGQMKISPDGTMIAYCAGYSNFVEIFRFNAQTGQVSQAISLWEGGKTVYGVEFSPNSKILYVTNINPGKELMQYSLLNMDSLHIKNSKTVIVNSGFELPSQLQLAPDGKIYIAKNNIGHLSAINAPDVLGTGCQYVLNQIRLAYNNTPPSICRLGLPNFISGFYKTVYVAPEPVIEEDNTVCNDIIVPNVLTPNGDQVNDRFKILCNKEYSEPDNFKLYNRWGQLVIDHEKNIKDYESLTDGTYFYTFSFNKSNYKGYVSVFH